jgi:phenylacetic acid degradation operon negative regulatory protein
VTETSLALAEAALEAYYLGDDAVRQIVFDPLLPEPLVCETARSAFREVVKRYDLAGHQVWREFLASADAVPGATPTRHDR